jgi:hypothetical protein
MNNRRRWRLMVDAWYPLDHRERAHAKYFTRLASL